MCVCAMEWKHPSFDVKALKRMHIRYSASASVNCMFMEWD